MKKIFLLFCLLVVSLIETNAQKVIQAEYFFDNNDIGYGLCNPITLIPSSDSSWSLQNNITLGGLNAGNHFIYIRSKDDSLNWSHTIQYSFVVPALNVNDSIFTGEWFVDDQDLGYGLCNSFGITNPDTNIVQQLPLQSTLFSTLSLGYHKVYYRLMDSNNQWSHTIMHNMEIVLSADSNRIYNIEYFNIVDLGYGNCNQYSISVPFIDSCITFSISYPYLSWNSADTFYVRVQDSINYLWSHTIKLGIGPDCIGIIQKGNDIKYDYDFKVYPNPASDKITIELNNFTSDKIKFSLYNILGKEVHSQMLNDYSTTIPLDYVSGIYFVKISSPKYSQTTKLIIN